MDRQFKVRRKQVLAECEVKPSLFVGVMDRLRRFVQPFAECLTGKEQQGYTQTYVAGLVSNLEYKNVESIAYLHDQDRRGLQRFIGMVPWEHRPLLTLLAQQVGAELGEADGIIVFDPSGFVKKGQSSVGVQRQWLGRVGKVDNGQVGVFMAYASRREHALVDVRLYLPKSWTDDRKRCRKAGVPKTEMRQRTRHELALAMLADSGKLLPHAWITGDDEMGRPTRFRQDLRELGERYLLAVPSNTRIRDLEAPLAPWCGVGRKPAPKWNRVDAWWRAVPEQAWTTIDVRDGEQGPLLVDVVVRRVQASTEKRRVGPEETLVVFRTDEGGQWKYDAFLSNAPAATPQAEFARVFKAEHRIEESLQRAKGEAGLADYEVRTWTGWHHHMTLSLLATWFLVQETRRGKKINTGVDRTAGSYRLGETIAACLGRLHPQRSSPRMRTASAPQRASTAVPLEKSQALGSVTRTSTLLTRQ